MVENPNDVGVPQALRQPCLAPKSLDVARITCELLAENLDRHNFVGVHIATEVDGGEPPRAHLIVYLVLALDDPADHLLSSQ